jgi:hypothetical protein
VGGANEKARTALNCTASQRAAFPDSDSDCSLQLFQIIYTYLLSSWITFFSKMYQRGVVKRNVLERSFSSSRHCPARQYVILWFRLFIPASAFFFTLVYYNLSEKHSYWFLSTRTSKQYLLQAKTAVALQRHPFLKFLSNYIWLPPVIKQNNCE